MSFFAFITLLGDALFARQSRPKAFADNPVLAFAYGALCLVALIAAAVAVVGIGAHFVS